MHTLVRLKRYAHIFALVSLCLTYACRTVAQTADGYYVHPVQDTTSTASTQSDDYRYYIDLKRKPDALKAVWLGAILPGAGQIYNRSYWKLPIVYGGFMGCGYAISLNQSRYDSYKQAYRDLYNDTQKGIVSTTDMTKTYNAVLPEGYTIERMGGVSKYTSTLQNWQSTYRRYRDISIAVTVAVYALTLIDAYVDAQLFDFDISPDLTLNIEPQIHYDLQQRRTTEVRLAIVF